MSWKWKLSEDDLLYYYNFLLQAELRSLRGSLFWGSQWTVWLAGISSHSSALEALCLCLFSGFLSCPGCCCHRHAAACWSEMKESVKLQSKGPKLPGKLLLGRETFHKVFHFVERRKSPLSPAWTLVSLQLVEWIYSTLMLFRRIQVLCWPSSVPVSGVVKLSLLMSVSLAALSLLLL